MLFRSNNNQQGGFNNNQGGGYNQGNQGGYGNAAPQGGYGNGGNNVNQGFQSPKPQQAPATAPADLDDDLPF